VTFPIRLILLLFSPGIVFAAAIGAAIDQQKVAEEFQSALSHYQSGQLDRAAAALEPLARELPRNFDIHELLGMVYSAQGRKQDANEHLQEAVRLNPNSAAARTNLATNLVEIGKLPLAEVQFKRALTLDPRGYDTNHNLGEFYVAAGKIPLSVTYLEAAQKIKPDAYDNGYDLALAYVETNRNTQAEHVVNDLLKQKDAAELHSLMGEIQEKSGNFVGAVHEYQSAAHMDPSESNLFDWGSELLLHRTLDPAVEIFQQATERYPQSQRLAIGLGMALYSRGNYDDAVKALIKAADLNPSDPRCYYFLSKAYDSSPGQADEVLQRFHRFAELQPRNARALYYYAMSLWKGRRAQDANVDFQQIETLLKKSIDLDSGFPEAHLQLGNLYSEQKKDALAVPQYERALALNTDLADAHYRLGQAYVRTGKKQQAQQQLEIYQRLRAQHMAELDKQRSEIRQFVYSAKGTQNAPAERNP
jgi:tetratricopeptide (TPR) repeat protein